MDEARQFDSPDERLQGLRHHFARGANATVGRLCSALAVVAGRGE
jgi:hypothetical protein